MGAWVHGWEREAWHALEAETGSGADRCRSARSCSVPSVRTASPWSRQARVIFEYVSLGFRRRVHARLFVRVLERVLAAIVFNPVPRTLDVDQRHGVRALAAQISAVERISRHDPVSGKLLHIYGLGRDTRADDIVNNAVSDAHIAASVAPARSKIDPFPDVRNRASGIPDGAAADRVPI